MSPASVALNTNDPVLAARNIRNIIFRQLQRRSPTWATLFGLEADRKVNGETAQSFTTDAFEVIQRDIEIAEVSDSGNISPAASINQAISKTVPTLVRALYGGLTVNWAAAPMSLDEYIHGGPGARHSLENVYASSIQTLLTKQLLTALFSLGAGANADGLRKWASITANKWGLDTSLGANYFFRGQTPTTPVAAFDEDLVREWIRLARTGELTEAGVTTFSDISTPSLGLVDTKTFNTMRKWVSDRQHIEMTRTQELAKIGGFYRTGVTIDEVTFLPEIELDNLRNTLGDEGIMFMLDPEALEFCFFKGFDFKFISNPDEALGVDGVNMPMRDFADVVWGKYCVYIVMWNIFYEHPRNLLFGRIQ